MVRWGCALAVAGLFAAGTIGTTSPRAADQLQVISGRPGVPTVVADHLGRFAVAWIASDESTYPESHQLLVMVGAVGSKARFVRALTSADRELGEIGIALDSHGRAVVVWSDGPWSRGVHPSENWYMARVDRNGDVLPLGHFVGDYSSEGLLRTPRGDFVAVAHRAGRIEVSILRRGASAFTEPSLGPPVPTRGTLEALGVAGPNLATLVFAQDRPGRTYEPERLVEQRMRFTGEVVGRTRAITPWGPLGLTGFDAYGGREAVSWDQAIAFVRRERKGRGSWVRTGRPGRLHPGVRLGPDRTAVHAQLTLSPAGRVFVVARRDDPGPTNWRPGIDPEPTSSVIAGEVGRRGLVGVRRLDRGGITRFDEWRVLRGRRAGTAVATWLDGPHLRATTLSRARVRRPTASTEFDSFGDYDAAVIDRRRLLVAIAENRIGLVKIRVLHL